MGAVEPRPGTAFAEYAEAVRIATSNVIAAVERNGRAVVIFTQDGDAGDAPAWQGLLERDNAGILRLLRPVRPTIFAADEIAESLVRLGRKQGTL